MNMSVKEVEWEEEEEFLTLDLKLDSVENLIQKEIIIKNDNLKPNDDNHSSFDSLDFVVIFVFCSVCCIVLILIIFFFFIKKNKSNNFDHENKNQSNFSNNNLKTETDNKNFFNSNKEVTFSSGSGSGIPILMERTISHEVCLEEVIGQGRYGEVWRGRWAGEQVAVKIFKKLDEDSWRKEVRLYQTEMLTHPSILSFIAADYKDRGLNIELWLITEYQKHGSLYDYLNEHELNEERSFEFCLSISKGLKHLHTFIQTAAVGGKPSIAHRDLKSKNILVMDNLQCCLSDFGLAFKEEKEKIKNLCFQDQNKMVFLGNHDNYSKIGTVRYMSPEILDGRLGVENNNIDHWKNSDIYALSLVFWEIMNRAKLNGIKTSYHLPYYDQVPPDPSMEEMNRVVNLSGLRPPIKQVWMSSEISKKLCEIMISCWLEERPSALRVMKNISNIKNFSSYNL